MIIEHKTSVVIHLDSEEREMLESCLATIVYKEEIPGSKQMEFLQNLYDNI